MIVGLPFSVYIIGAGRHVFAFLSLVASYTQVTRLHISIGEHANDNPHAWTLARKETLGCHCNLESNLYNYVGGLHTWPYCRKNVIKIDH